MEQGEILDRLKKIVTEHDMHHSISPLPPSANTCWFDGNICPYGFPNGRFQDRPEQICHLGTDGCNRLITLEENVEDFCGNYYEDKISERLHNAVEKNEVSLSSELKVIAEQCEDESPEQQILELAADIILEQYEKNILRIDDI